MKKKKNFLKKTYDSPWRPGHSVKEEEKTVWPIGSAF